MKVFLAWSGERSEQVANVLGAWLAGVIQSVEPWYSPDMTKGVKWIPEIGAQLESAGLGICCLTPENLGAPWISFEAGALSRGPKTHVCTFLTDLKPTDVTGPLSQFQPTVLTQ